MYNKQIHNINYSTTFAYKNSLGDEIANVNWFTKISHTYFKIPKKNVLRLAN